MNSQMSSLEITLDRLNVSILELVSKLVIASSVNLNFISINLLQHKKNLLNIVFNFTTIYKPFKTVLRKNNPATKTCKRKVQNDTIRKKKTA